MQIAIWGAGAVGLGLASALARQGESLRIVSRAPDTLAALASEGLQRTGLFGDRHVPASSLVVGDDPRALCDVPPDWLLVCTKTVAGPTVARALEPLRPALVDRTRLVLCQNGWENELPFLRFWPRRRLLHARVITGFQRRRPNHVEITAHAAPIAIGSLFGEPARIAAPLAERLAAGGLPSETRDDMHGVLWAKMLYNCALNPLGALVGRRYGELTAHPEANALVERVAHEIFAVLDAAGIQVAWRGAREYLESFHHELIPPTAAHESSMLQDLRAGRPTEIEALCGAVERLAEQHGVATPVVSALATLVRGAQATGPADRMR